VKNIIIISLILSSFLSLAQIEANKDIAVSISNIKNYESKNQEFVTAELKEEQPLGGTCYDKPFTYGKWFKFQATTAEIETSVIIDDKDGSMKQPFLYLYNDNLVNLICESPLDDTTNISLISNKLVIGDWYYIAVYNRNHSMYVGHFILTTKDKISNDFVEGAYEITNPVNWVSEKITLNRATADGVKPSCLPHGPNFNKWYKFNAISKKAEIEINYGGEYGNAQFPYLTLWNKNFNEVVCDKYSNDHQETKIELENLNAGDTYYISVDHPYNHKYLGTFLLSVDNANEKDVVVQTTDLQKVDLEKIVGKVMFKTDLSPSNGKNISLFDNSVKVKTTTTDANGRFVFKNIEPNKNFMIVIEDHGDNLLFEIYQTNSNGEIVKQKVKHSKSAFGFEDLSASCNKIVLLDCNRSFDLNISPGKVGMIGKVVNKQLPTSSMNDVSVYLYDKSKQVLDSTKTNNNGDFEFVNLSKSDEHMIKLGISLDKVIAEILVVNDKGIAISTSSSRNVNADGFFGFEKLPNIIAKPLTQMNFEDVDINLSLELTPGSSIVLNNIYFNAGKDELLPSSYTELDKLVILLNKNSKVNIEVGGHTDDFGNDAINIPLSKNRAMAVEQYLTSKGITADRLSHMGYGSNKPIASNDTAEGRKKNRRVEFLVK
jgi:outer membrane protein OmpA-like peptidoglycan-associated protein